MPKSFQKFCKERPEDAKHLIMTEPIRKFESFDGPQPGDGEGGDGERGEEKKQTD
jgi:hypothetical protein